MIKSFIFSSLFKNAKLHNKQKQIFGWLCDYDPTLLLTEIGRESRVVLLQREKMNGGNWQKWQGVVVRLIIVGLQWQPCRSELDG